jgi:hypothetical protein
MHRREVPNPVVMVVGDVLGEEYYSHTKLNTLFAENGAPGDPPAANCVRKCQAWLKRCNADPSVDAYAVLGGVLADFMDRVDDPFWEGQEPYLKQRKRVEVVLAKHGLTYHSGGRIVGSDLGPPSRTLAQILASRDLEALQAEFDRALATVTSDPGGALTAACAIVESFCKVYIEDRELELPSKQSIKPLWAVVSEDLGLKAGAGTPEDVRPILSGLAAVIDGLGAYRTHAGSAHGQGRKRYDVKPRHARLAVHAAHTLVAFAIETWEQRSESTTLREREDAP